MSVSAGETVTCTFLNRKRGQIIVVKDAHAERRRRTSASRRAAGLSPTELRSSTSTPTRPTRTRSTFDERACPGRLLASPRPCRAAGTRRAPPVTTAARCPNIVVTRARRSPARSRTASAADRGRQERDPERPAGLQLHRRRRAQPGELLARRRLERHAVEHADLLERGAGARLLAVRDGARRLGPDQRDLRRRQSRVRISTSRPGEIVTCTFDNAQAGQIVVVKDATPERPAGLQLHGGRRAQPGELLARRRLGRDAFQHAHLQRRGPGSGYSLAETRAERLGPDAARRVTTAARRRHHRVAGRDRDLHLLEPQARQRGRRRGRDAERRPGLQLHGGRRPQPLELLARRRRRRDAVQHAHVRRRRPGRRLLARADGAERLGPGRRATCNDGSPVSNIVGRGRRDGHLHVHATSSRAASRWSRTRMPDDAQDFSFTAGGGLSPASFSLDDDADGTLSNTRTFTGVSAQARLLGRREPPPPAGTRRARPATTAARCRTSRCRPGEDVHLHVRQREARARSWWSRTPIPNDAQDFSFTAGGGLSPASFQLDDDARRDPVEHAHLRRRRSRLRILALRVGARRLDPGERDMRRRQPGVQHRRRRRRDRHLHVRQPAWLPAAAGRHSAEGLAGPRVHAVRLAEQDARPQPLVRLRATRR